MSFNSYARPRTLLAGGAALVAGAAVWLALAGGLAGGNAGATGTATTDHCGH